MSENVQSKPVKATHFMRRVMIFAALLLGAFLIGFVPLWSQSRESASRLAEVEHQLSLAGLQNALASAVIDARQGEYESARQAVSDFFTVLRAETDRENDSALSPAQRAGVQPLYTQRDEIITLLARGDPASADRLSDLYAAYRKIMNS
ncbi:hypothetical protein TFLX_02631 [Thermoflexales bacterium]|nr:hypothetical protein TFLX_02631 [Thermoflexales bacterium]